MAYLKLTLFNLLLSLLWAGLALYGGLNGWWLSAMATPGDTRQFMHAATNMIDESSPGNVALSTGPAYLSSRIAYQWGLWEAGYPDFIQSGTAIDSARRPMLYGLLIISAATLLLWLRLFRRRSRIRSRTHENDRDSGK